MNKKKKNKSKLKQNNSLSFREQIKPVFKERFKEMLKTQDEYDKFEEIILTPQRKSFRINGIKTNNSEELIFSLKSKGIKFSQVPWCENSFFIDFSKDETQRGDLGNLYEHFLGKIYVQEATSMTPPLLLEIPEDIPRDFKVLDMASSPGSKTTQLGDYMNNKGILVANELDYKRLGPLKINLERSGLTNVIITNNDGSLIKGEEVFDRILLDAPCSGSGVIRKSPKTIRTYNPNQLKSISKLQLKLIQRAFELLKKGGIMTYSTCSLDPEENEFLIDDFLKNNSNAKLMEAKLDNIILNNKLTEFQGRKIPIEITEKTIRIWPQDNDTNGFFVAKIKKI